MLGNTGRALTGGLYNLVSSPEERAAYQEQLKNKRDLANLRELANMQLALDRRRADDAAARDLEANYRNTLNQMLVNEQVLDAQQQAAMMAMLGRYGYLFHSRAQRSFELRSLFRPVTAVPGFSR